MLPARARMGPAIVCTGLSKSFGKVETLRDLTLTVSPRRDAKHQVLTAGRKDSSEPSHHGALGGGMHPLLLLVVAAVLIPSTAPPGSLAGEPLAVDGACSPSDPGSWTCSFTASVFDPTLVLFRWDFEGDGQWDTPWTIGTSPIYTFYDGGVFRVTLLGWDGFSTANGEPIGPRAHKNLVLGGELMFTPSKWNRTATGPLYATWELPSGFSPSAPRPRNATFYGVPAMPLPRPRNLASEPVVQGFRLDRAAVTRLFGSGDYSVYLRGYWGSYEFVTSLANITIL